MISQSGLLDQKILQLESMINSYLRDVGIYLKENSLLISAPKSTVTHQFQMYPKITLEDKQVPLERSPKILGVIMDQSLSIHKQYAKCVGGIVMETGQEDVTTALQRIGEIYRSYAAPIWSTQRK